MKRLSSSRNFPIRKLLQHALTSRSHRKGMDHFHPGDFKTDYLTVELRKLDPAFDGYRIVHLTDLHVSYWFSPEQLAGIVDLVNQLYPPETLLITLKPI